MWNGAIKGEVYDSYSGLGAISTDLCILGDVRDLGTQSWKYVTGSEDFDRFIMLLSAAGVGLFSTGIANGCNALAKSTAKYLKNIPGVAKNGILRRLLETKLSYKQSEKIWNLLKKTNGPSRVPHPVYPVSMTRSISTQHYTLLDVMEAPATSSSISLAKMACFSTAHFPTGSGKLLSTHSRRTLKAFWVSPGHISSSIPSKSSISTI